MYFEEFSLNQKFTSRPRVITATDVELFCALTGATNPLFLDDQFAKSLGHKSRIVPGLLTVALITGQNYQLGIFDHIIALAGIDKLKFKAPVYIGDSIKSEVEVIEKREIDSSRGLVRLRVSCFNQAGQVVAEWEQVMVVKRSAS